MQCLEEAKTSEEKRFWASGIRSLVGINIVTESEILMRSQNKSQKLVTAYMREHADEPFLMLELWSMLWNKGYFISEYFLKLELKELVSMKFVKSFYSKEKSGDDNRPVKHYQWVTKHSRAKLSV
jgi:hypothetical protein